MLSFDENGWLYPDPLKNITHDIGIVEINDLLKLANEEDFWSACVREDVKKRLEKDKKGVRLDWFVEDLMIKNTGGTVISMPFGKDIITFNSNRHFFRGENQQFLKSLPSLRRKQEGKSKYESELIKVIAVMRSFQFLKFIWKIDVVPFWKAKLSDINIDALAQHYGFDTCLLDLTNDFRTALFFATCKYDYKTDSYRPLTKKDIEATEDSKYGVIFHSPNWVLDYLNGGSFEWHMHRLNNPDKGPYSFYSGYLDGMAFQIGYQPLMRCHHQSGYIMPMMNATPLQSDNRFEKLRFLQSEELSNRVYEMMDKGKKIFPHEGIGKSLDILRTIQKAVIFSEDDLLYAYDFGEVDKKMFPTIDNLRKAITTFQVDGKCVSIQKGEIEYPISPSVLQEINDEYNGRNLLDDIGNMIHQYPEQRWYREKRCIDIYGKLI
ncbi:FRG domain-containing protein [Holdemanella biformis]|uniref:FRG domain-containing protein n=1 Tax=Holdemanella biformis TaxID=1735 RepID=UPI0022DEFBAE|nr:FRG domain-containing protein [Holdemanella biformis]